MSDGHIYVLDASVGVKWFTPESGQEAALGLIDRAAHGEISLVAPAHFAHEVLAVVARHYTPADVPAAWERLCAAGLALLPLSDGIVREAARQSELLGRSFYDALAPACAVLLDATLASADARAHGAFPGVFLVR